MNNKTSFIAAFGGCDYDGVLLKIEKDELDVVADAWVEHQNFHDCLELQHADVPPGIYRVEVRVETSVGEFEGDKFITAKHPLFTPVSWPDCVPLYDPNTDTCPAETV